MRVYTFVDMSCKIVRNANSRPYKAYFLGI